MAHSCLKYPRSLLHSEESLVAKDIDIVSQPFGGNSRYHLIDDQIYVSSPVIPVFQGYGMSPEKGCLYRQG